MFTKKQNKELTLCNERASSLEHRAFNKCRKVRVSRALFKPSNEECKKASEEAIIVSNECLSLHLKYSFKSKLSV